MQLSYVVGYQGKAGQAFVDKEERNSMEPYW